MKREALHVEFCDDHCLHHITKVEKKTFNSYIYTLFLDCFSVLFVKIRCELIRGTDYLSTCSAMTFNSRRHDVTSIEHNADQS